MLPSAEKLLHEFLIAVCLLKNSISRLISRGEVSAGLPAGRTEVERCYSSARQTFPLHTHARAHTYTYTISYITGHSSAQSTKNPSSCLTKFSTCLSHPIPFTHIELRLLSSSFVLTSLKINRARFPQWVLPSRSHPPHIATQERSSFQQETLSTLKKETKSAQVSLTEQIYGIWSLKKSCNKAQSHDAKQQKRKPFLMLAAEPNFSLTCHPNSSIFSDKKVNMFDI